MPLKLAFGRRPAVYIFCHSYSTAHQHRPTYFKKDTMWAPLYTSAFYSCAPSLLHRLHFKHKDKKIERFPPFAFFAGLWEPIDENNSEFGLKTVLQEDATVQIQCARQDNAVAGEGHHVEVAAARSGGEAFLSRVTAARHVGRFGEKRRATHTATEKRPKRGDTRGSRREPNYPRRG